VLDLIGAQGRTRTDTVSLPADFESAASTDFATWAISASNQQIAELTELMGPHYTNSQEERKFFFLGFVSNAE
jgi:hypothetical protein